MRWIDKLMLYSETISASVTINRADTYRKKLTLKK
jgi:hypothetical protein